MPPEAKKMVSGKKEIAVNAGRKPGRVGHQNKGGTKRGSDGAGRATQVMGGVARDRRKCLRLDASWKSHGKGKKGGGVLPSIIAVGGRNNLLVLGT